MLTEVLLEVTGQEVHSIAREVYSKARASASKGITYTCIGFVHRLCHYWGSHITVITLHSAADLSYLTSAGLWLINILNTFYTLELIVKQHSSINSHFSIVLCITQNIYDCIKVNFEKLYREWSECMFTVCVFFSLVLHMNCCILLDFINKNILLKMSFHSFQF